MYDILIVSNKEGGKHMQSKVIKVSENMHDKLTEIKVKEGHSSYREVVQALYYVYKKEASPCQVK